MNSNVEAGRELDILVATKVMGWRDKGNGTFTNDADRQWSVDASHIPKFSTNIAQAWRVVEKMRDWSPLVNMIKPDMWHCCLTPPGTPMDIFDTDEGWIQKGKRFHAEAPTAELAICLATLATVQP